MILVIRAGRSSLWNPPHQPWLPLHCFSDLHYQYHHHWFYHQHRFIVLSVANYRRSWFNDTVECADSMSCQQKPMIGKFLLALSEFWKLWKQMCWRLNFCRLSSQAIQWRRRNAKLAFFQSDIPRVRKSGCKIFQKRQIIGLDKVLGPSLAFDAHLTFCSSILMHLVRSMCFKPKRNHALLCFFPASKHGGQ